MASTCGLRSTDYGVVLTGSLSPDTAGVMYGFFYGLIYVTYWLAMAVLVRLVKQPDDDEDDASFFDVD